MLKDGEKWEPLGNGIQIIVSDEHKFWTDTVLLASFAKPKKVTTPVTWVRGAVPFR